MKSIKQVNIENHPYYFFNDMINIRNFDPNSLSINKISFKNIDAVIQNIKYINRVNIDNENSLYLIFNDVDGYIGKECNGDKYLVFASTDKNKKVLKKYTEL